MQDGSSQNFQQHNRWEDNISMLLMDFLNSMNTRTFEEVTCCCFDVRKKQSWQLLAVIRPMS